MATLSSFTDMNSHLLIGHVQFCVSQEICIHGLNYEWEHPNVDMMDKELNQMRDY